METYNGHVRTPADAIILFEACRIGLLPRVQRRLSEKERQSIKSGSVFVWDEREAGMRRWTDGKSWSASRVSGSFLTYREMEGKRGGNSVDKSGARDSTGKANTATTAATENSTAQNDPDSDGGGPDGYRYKPDGLIKQSFSITTTNGQHLHLISYFARSSTATQNLVQPTSDPQLRHIRPEKGLYPESTVHEQSTIPAVTRGPMPSPTNGTYTRSPNQSAAYPRQQYGYGPWAPPSPMHTPPQHHQYTTYYPHGSSGQYPGQSTHPPPPPPHHHQSAPYPGHYHHPPGPTAYDRPPPPGSSGMAPPVQPPHYSHPPPNYPPPSGYPSYSHSYPYNPPPHTAHPYAPPHHQPYPHHREMENGGPHRAPVGDRAPIKEYRHDAYANGPGESRQPPSHAHAQHHHAPPPPHSHPPPAPYSREAHSESSAPPPPSSSSSGQTIPSISAMLNGGTDSRPGASSHHPPAHSYGGPPPPPGSSAHRPLSRSPPSHRPLQDIPSHKLGFEASRDVNVLRNLDKATFKF